MLYLTLLFFCTWNQEYVDHLNTFKKKDDLCDAYLHGVHYIQKNLEPGKGKVKKGKVEANSESVVQENPKPKTKSTLEIDIGVKRKPKSTKKTKKVTTNEV